MARVTNQPSSTSGLPSARIEAQLRRARDGSDSALGQLFEACRRYLLLVANRGLDSDLRPKRGASDLVQDTFVEAKKAFGQFRGTTEEELFAWLTRILSHRVQKHVRAFRNTQKREIGREVSFDDAIGALSLEDESETPSAVAIARSERQRVQQVMQRLPEIDRQVLLLRTWQQLSFEEIGVIMDRSPEAARKLWARAVERLGREVDALP